MPINSPDWPALAKLALESAKRDPQDEKDLKEMRILVARLAFLALRMAYKHYRKQKRKRK